MLKSLFSILILIICLNANAQKNETGQDTTKKTAELSEVIITATRSEQVSERLPVPVTVISGKEIQAAGMMRITDVFSEVNGASVVENFGSGLQLRGLDPAYTLILVDGEPVTGRNGGTFDLAKIPADDVDRIEVVKGPASTLYGSEALAGVVNIITKNPSQGASGQVRAVYGSNTTSVISGTLNHGSGKFSSKISANGFHTSGYDLDKASLYNSGSENSNGTLNGKLGIWMNDKISFSLKTRCYKEKVTNVDRFSVEGIEHDFDMLDHTVEYSLTPGIKYYAGNNTFLSLSNHFSLYDYKSQLKYSDGGELYYDDRFRQMYFKPEIIFDRKITEKFTVTSGAGHIAEKISSSRYKDDKHQSTAFFFLQGYATVFKKVTFLNGARIDYSSVYDANISPKVSMQYSPRKKMQVFASWGKGFKSPDFRQLYLSFNNSVIGYSVYGSEEIVNQLEQMEQDGIIESILISKEEIGKLNPETSSAFDAGIRLAFSPAVSATINAFRNDVNELIETKPVAQKTNGQYVYSYVNLNRVYTQGLECDMKANFSGSISATAGFRYLEAKDKKAEEDIREGKIYARDPETLASYKVSEEDYGGLFNRSKYAFNVKFSCANLKQRWQASMRYLYKGKYGFADMNGNLILDADNEYVNGYGLFNASASKEIGKRLLVQATVNNLLGYTNAKYISSLSGRTFLLSIRYNFFNQE